MILSCENVSVRYKTVDYYIISDLSISLDRGETLILTGKNGSGKSTLINTIVGTNDDTCDISGNIFINGLSMNCCKNKMIARRSYISCMPQNFKEAFFNMQKIKKQLYEVAKLSQKYKKTEINSAIYKIFDRLGFSDTEKVLTSYPYELSLGMLSRCMLAMCLITKPDLLILDEPLSALNIELKNEILRLICDYQQNSGCALIIITHNKNLIDDFFNNKKYLHLGE